MNRVPNIAAVVRGARVNIVLKADQPTGRTVAGDVQDILTRGNHPRGIKVRLTDGRVGRVQSMAAQGQQSASASSLGQGFTAGESSHHGAGREERRHRGDQDMRGEAELPPQTIGLDAYIKPAKQKKRRGSSTALNQQTSATSTDTPEVISCPVCGEFQGDAAAVEHHVGMHFD